MTCDTPGNWPLVCCRVSGYTMYCQQQTRQGKVVRMLYGQSNFWQKPSARSNKAYAIASDVSGQDVVMVWDEAHASRICRDMDLDMRGEARDAFHRAYGVMSVSKCSAVDAKKLMRAGARVIVTSAAVTVGIKSYEEVAA